jgi:hypothetical protein
MRKPASEVFLGANLRSTCSANAAIRKDYGTNRMGRNIAILWMACYAFPFGALQLFTSTLTAAPYLPPVFQPWGNLVDALVAFHLVI